MTSKLAIVGDVHGASKQLAEALSFFRDHEMGVALVGDYINRGPDSAGVLELLADAKADMGEDLILCRGNHESALLHYLDTGDIKPFLIHDGLTTMRSYGGSGVENDTFEGFRRTFPDRHRRLLNKTVQFIESAVTLISHCGYNPAFPGRRRQEDVVTGSHYDIFQSTALPPRELVVCGHYIQRSMTPYLSDHLVCLDTGCGSIEGAPLTALTLPDRQILQF